MRITFGLHLDSCQGPSRRNALNEPVVGRLGLLGLLETYLGLSRPDVSAARRVTAYLGHLRQHADSPRFYSRSLEADSVGTAAKLLSWRDEWRLGGWDGTAPAGAPRRLQELALVEQTAVADIPAGEAERLADVLAALAVQRTPIESVVLVDPPESFPLAWRKVLALLPNKVLWHPEPLGAGQLGHLQALAFHATYYRQLEVIDGSIDTDRVMLVQAGSRETAEHWLSAISRQAPVDRLIVCESDGDSLDATLMATGCASSGFENPSELRPALQAVGLALEMCWAPVDVGRLIEFLSHPVGPFSRAARVSLGRAVAKQPGIGGEAWESAKASLTADEDGKALAEDIAFWLEGERWKRSTGAPVDALLARVDRLAAALRKRFTGDEAARAALAPAVEQCSAVRDGLQEFKRQGVASLTPRQVEQLIVHATPSGATNPGAPAQVGCIRAEASAGACIEPADEVIWWMPATPRLPAPLPWTQAEVDALEALGVQLRRPMQELEALARQWLRPLCAARQRFVMVLPPPGAEVHPFRQLLMKLAPDLEKSCIDLDSQLGGGFVGSLSTELERLPLPATPECIELAKPLAIPVEGQSYTSLSELFNAPALYAVKRVARLRPTAVLEAEEDHRLLGTLGHRVFEKLFANEGSLGWTDDQALAWFRTNVDDLLAKEGALLLMHGAGISQQRFKAVCEGAICSMLSQLRAADAVRVRSELSLKGRLGDVQVDGKTDLLIDLPESRTVTLDLKWSGGKYHAEALQKGQHLQLAIYASLYEQQTGVTPVAVGYFIFDSGTLFISAPNLLPHAQVRMPPPGATAALLQQAKDTWIWRAKQLAAGQIDVVPIDAEGLFQGPEGTLPVRGPKSWDKDHLVLFGGWEQ